MSETADGDGGGSELPSRQELWQTHIYNSEMGFHSYGGIVISDPESSISALENPPDERQLVLTEGGPIEPVEPNAPYSWQSSEDGRAYRTVITDPATAVGYYLHSLETHGVDEEQCLMMLRSIANGGDEYADPGNLPAHLERWGDLIDISKRARRLRLMDLLDTRIEARDWIAEKYYEAGATWRSTDLSESGTALARDLVRRLGDIDLPHPRLCYATAGEAARLAENNHRVEYVEGVVLPKQSGQAIRHAWLEIDGEVAELTWPWHAFDEDRAVYFGTPIEKSTVVETRERRPRNGPVILDDEESKLFANAKSGSLAGSN